MVVEVEGWSRGANLAERGERTNTVAAAMKVPPALKGLVRSVVPRSLEVPLRYYYRRFAGELEAEEQLLSLLVRPNSVAVDVGAAVGTYTYPLSRLCRRVEAFEPFPEQCPGLGVIKRCVLHPIALSDQDGTIAMHVPIWSGKPFYSNSSVHPIEGNSRTVQVPTATLDSFELDDVSFIKIDAEGHEEFVLRGGVKTLARCRPNLLIEIEQRNVSKPLSQILEDVLAFGYHGFFLFHNSLLPLSRFDLLKHQDVAAGILNSGYVSNFVFCPSS